jgi:transcriptional regulator with AAA-type ATPase domain
VLARALLELSDRRAEPFRVAQCAAFAGGLVEDELFGHVKGAFTGAERDRAGKLAEAGRGTPLLDGVHSVAARSQLPTAGDGFCVPTTMKRWLAPRRLSGRRRCPRAVAPF